MFDTEKFKEIADKKVDITQLQDEIDEIENELRKTFADDVANFFLSKGYELDYANQYNSINEIYNRDKKFLNLQQLDKQNTFYSGDEPKFFITGKNDLIVFFTWHLTKNKGSSHVYWYPEKQTLEDFYNRRLKKVLILPIKVQRKKKLNNITNNQDSEKIR